MPNARERRALGARLEAAGLSLGELRLPIQDLDPRMRYPVPPEVWLVDRPPKAIEDALGYADGVGGGWLKWTYAAAGAPPESEPIAGCVGRFVDLAEAPAEAVRAFAAKWGVLGICRHGLPSTHAPGCHPLGIPALGPGFDAVGEAAWEPVHFWNRYTRRARGVLNAVARLQHGEGFSAADWRDIEGDRPQRTLEHGMTDRRTIPGWAQREIARSVNDWLRDAAVTPAVRWDAKADGYVVSVTPPPRSPLQETYGFLFGVLGIQVAAAVCSRLYRCSECGKVYEPDPGGRAPRTDRRRFCSPACADASKRKQKLRQYHARKDEWPSRKRRARARAAQSVG